MTAIQKVINQIKRAYIRSYIQKNGSWPPVQLNSLCPDAFKAAQQTNTDPEGLVIGKSHGTVSSDDYVYVDLLPNMELDRLEHYVQYLTDKTLAVTRSQVLTHYLAGQNESGGPSWEDTRRLLHFMFHSEGELGLADYLNEYMAPGDFTLYVLEKFIIKPVGKEGERKAPEARPFRCKTFQDR